MPAYRYRIVDVFTETPLEGNPLAVFLDTAGMEPATMQKIAREMNLSETVFVGAPARSDCAARVRIFTPTREMLFAGHPTIGASFVILAEGIVPASSTHFTLEEGVGPVPILVEPGAAPRIWLQTPPITFGATFDAGACAASLGLADTDLLDIPPQLVSAGNPTVFVAVRDCAAVDRASLDLAGARAIGAVGAGSVEQFCVFVFAPTPAGAYSRMFAPEYGIVEDPATGSSTGPLAAFLMRHGLARSEPGTRFVSEQGTRMGRRSMLHVHVPDAEKILVGGHTAPVAQGTLTLP